MLRLHQLSLTRFKNYPDRRFAFGQRVTGICGKNGVGKTNLLDAIHYLCFTKSYFTRTDAANALHGSAGFRLQGDFELLDKPEKTVCILRENGKKEFAVNDNPYDKFSHHIGRYPCVMIAPDDAALITGDSRERRSFIDALLCQIFPEYLQQLIVYKKVLDQRNALLKSFAETGQKNLPLLDVLDAQLAAPGDLLFTQRKQFLVAFLPEVKHLYDEIARQEAENVHLYYESELLTTGMADLLQQNRPRDLAAQRTTSGIHRDDLVMQTGELPFRGTASQGQRKSLLFALKLAEMNVLHREKHFAPILLLDDVFEKLDEERISNLLRKVCLENDGQVFITDTNEQRLREHLEAIGVPFEMISL